MKAKDDLTFLVGKDLKKAMKEIGGTGDFDAAIAYWGGEALDLLGLPQNLSNARIVCDAFSGACNPSALKDLLARGAQLSTLDGLHAKVLIGRNDTIVGSANASSNGLALQGNELDFGLEASVASKSKRVRKQAKAWMARVLKKSAPVTLDDIRKLEGLWAKRRHMRPSINSEISLAEALTGHPELLRDRRLFVAITYPDDPPDEVEERYVESQFGKPRTTSDDQCLFFWDARGWKCKAGDFILSFERDVDEEKYVYDDLWEVQGTIDRGAIVPLDYAKSAFGMRMNRRMGNALAKRVSRLAKQGQISGTSVYLSAGKFMELLEPSEN